MKVAVSADHAGVLLRRRVIEHLTGRGHEVVDLGIDDPDEPDDYPDRAEECGGQRIVGQRVPRDPRHSWRARGSSAISSIGPTAKASNHIPSGRPLEVATS